LKLDEKKVIIKLSERNCSQKSIADALIESESVLHFKVLEEVEMAQKCRKCATKWKTKEN